VRVIWAIREYAPDMASVQQSRAGTIELERLEEHEDAVSSRRRELLAEIDQLQLDAPLTDIQSARLTAIEVEERALSSLRRTLQHQIDGLRLRLRLPQGPRVR
jgi:hypothetical protein